MFVNLHGGVVDPTPNNRFRNWLNRSIDNPFECIRLAVVYQMKGYPKVFKNIRYSYSFLRVLSPSLQSKWGL